MYASKRSFILMKHFAIFTGSVPEFNNCLKSIELKSKTSSILLNNVFSSSKRRHALSFQSCKYLKILKKNCHFSLYFLNVSYIKSHPLITCPKSSTYVLSESIISRQALSHSVILPLSNSFSL